MFEKLFNYICLSCTIYIFIKLFLKLYSLFNDYILPSFLSPSDFKSYGQWAVVTGSTDGIGKEFAKQLASKGVDICLISRNKEKLQNTAKEIEQTYGVKTKYIIADFTDTNVYGNIKQNLTNLDIGILVNNVGIVDEIEELCCHSDKVVQDYINVNLMSLCKLTHMVIPGMMERKRGLILNMSSLGSEISLPYLSIYCGCKAFITMFGRCLSYELKKHNIQMTTLIPGMIRTNLLLRYSYVLILINKLVPFIVLPTDIFVQKALKTVRSGSIITCAYYIYDLVIIVGSYLPLGWIGEIAVYYKKKEKRL